MELYTKTAYSLSRDLTLRYSTSFGKSSKLFDAAIRLHIYAIYGLVRIADEIVDTYNSDDKAELLDALEAETYATLASGFSTNPIVHAFSTTARQFGITKVLIAPFFASMRSDITPAPFTQKQYEQYIFGSAEVIGLMCLKVFTKNNKASYAALEPSAKALGSAYQKVNFLRDIASDYYDRGRSYFPYISFETFDENAKRKVIADIKKDFQHAQVGISRLPKNAKKAVQLSYAYYQTLLSMLEKTPVETIKKKRVRVSNARKALIALNVRRKSSGVSQ